MPLISTSFPNLNGGVSQQPASQRLETQCEAQENALPLVIGGLVKRPPTNHVAELKQSGGAALDLSDSFVHFIQRDENEKYILTVTGEGSLNIYDINGAYQTVSYPGGTNTLPYLADSTPETLRAITIGDVTWIVNTQTSVAMTAGTSPASISAHEALLWLKASGQGLKIRVAITVAGGTTQAVIIEHEPQVHTQGSAAHLDPTPVRTNELAEYLRSGGTPPADDGLTITYEGGATAGINSFSNITAQRIGNVLYIYTNNGDDFNIEVEDSLGNNAHSLVKGTAQQFSDLPGSARDGMIVKVEGDPESEIDDYYVKFERNGPGTGVGDGLWVETVEPEIPYRIDSATMPLILVRQPTSGGYNPFVIKPADGNAPNNNAGHPDLADRWQDFKFADREAGSELTNPLPSYIGNPIQDIAYFKGRLCFVSGENISLSEAGEFFNFFRTTVTQLLDSATIDVGVGGTDVNNLTRAVPFSDRLVLFSERAQFILQGVPILTPQTATVTRATTFNSSGTCAPVPAGNTLFFPFSRGAYSGVREFYKTNETDINFDATESTLQVPRYIKGDIKTMTASNHEDIIVIRAEDADTLYAYKFFRTPQGRVQSAWFRMILPEAEVIQCAFLQQSLFLVVKRGVETYLERMDLQTGLLDDNADYVTHLDRRILVTGDGTNSPSSGNTIYLTNTSRPDYSLTELEQAAVKVVSTDGKVMSIASTTVDSITLEEQFAADDKFYIGLPYTMRYELTKPTFKRTIDQGSGVETIATGRHQLRYMTVVYDDSAFFTVKVTNEVADVDGTTIEYPFSGRFLSTGGFLGQVPSVDGKFRFPIFAESDAVKIEIENDSPFPSNIQSIQFEAQYTSRSQFA